MPAVYIGVMMESGDIKWRPKFSAGLSDEGPEDKHLIIDFTGHMTSLPWVTLTSYGYAIDLNALAISVPVLFDKKWLRNRGLTKANFTEAGNNRYVIDMRL